MSSCRRGSLAEANAARRTIPSPRESWTATGPSREMERELDPVDHQSCPTFDYARSHEGFPVGGRPRQVAEKAKHELNLTWTIARYTQRHEQRADHRRI